MKTGGVIFTVIHVPVSWRMETPPRSLPNSESSASEASDAVQKHSHADTKRHSHPGLENLFENLKELVPETKDMMLIPERDILRKAAAYCTRLTEEDQERTLLKERQHMLNETLRTLQIEINKRTKTQDTDNNEDEMVDVVSVDEPCGGLWSQRMSTEVPSQDDEDRNQQSQRILPVKKRSCLASSTLQSSVKKAQRSSKRSLLTSRSLSPRSLLSIPRTEPSKTRTTVTESKTIKARPLFTVTWSRPQSSSALLPMAVTLSESPAKKSEPTTTQSLLSATCSTSPAKQPKHSLIKSLLSKPPLASPVTESKSSLLIPQSLSPVRCSETMDNRSLLIPKSKSPTTCLETLVSNDNQSLLIPESVAPSTYQEPLASINRSLLIPKSITPTIYSETLESESLFVPQSVSPTTFSESSVNRSLLLPKSISPPTKSETLENESLLLPLSVSPSSYSETLANQSFLFPQSASPKSCSESPGAPSLLMPRSVSPTKYSETLMNESLLIPRSVSLATFSESFIKSSLLTARSSAPVTRSQTAASRSPPKPRSLSPCSEKSVKRSSHISRAQSLANRSRGPHKQRSHIPRSLDSQSTSPNSRSQSPNSRSVSLNSVSSNSRSVSPDSPLLYRRSTKPSRVRKLHNDRERERRSGLNEYFNNLRSLVPATEYKKRAPKVRILKEATAYCRQLQQEDEQRKFLLRRQKKLIDKLETLRLQFSKGNHSVNITIEHFS